MDSVLGQLAQTTWITKLVNMQGSTIDRNRISPYSMMEYQQFIYACQQSIPGSSFLGVYFPRKNFIISSRMNGTLDFLLHDALAFGTLTKETLDGKIAGLKEKETLYLAEDDVFQYGKRGSGILAVKAILKLPDDQAPGAVLISFVSFDRFLRAVDSILDSSDFISLTIDDNSENIFSIGANNRDGGFTIQNMSAVTGWEYKLDYSKSTLQQEIMTARNFLFLIIAGILFVCLLISTIFTNKIYKPVLPTLNLPFLRYANKVCQAPAFLLCQ